MKMRAARPLRGSRRTACTAPSATSWPLLSSRGPASREEDYLILPFRKSSPGTGGKPDGPRLLPEKNPGVSGAEIFR
jgi:hypothetical protein